MGNGTFSLQKVQTRAKTQTRMPGPNVRRLENTNRAMMMQLMAEKLGTARQGGTPLHDLLEEMDDVS